MNKNKSPVDSGFSDSQKAFIRSEITSQLVALKKQIDLEIAEDIARIDSKIADAIRDALAKQSTAVDQKCAEAVRAVDAKIATAKNQITVANNGQLVQSQEQTRQMIQAVGQQITNATYKRVIAEINREIVPKVNSMVEFVNYQMQDPGEIVTDYRRAVNSSQNDGAKMLTDGDNRHVISEHVSLFFREDN